MENRNELKYKNYIVKSEENLKENLLFVEEKDISNYSKKDISITNYDLLNIVEFITENKINNKVLISIPNMYGNKNYEIGLIKDNKLDKIITPKVTKDTIEFEAEEIFISTFNFALTSNIWRC